MIAVAILIIFAVIAIIALVLISKTYNRRLDRIVKGEERDRHSNIPDPGTSVSVIYQSALFLISITTLFIVLGRTALLQAEVERMQSNQIVMESMLESSRDFLENNNGVVGAVTYEIMNPDIEKMTAEVDYYVGLREYTEDTIVNLSLNGKTYELTKKEGGTFEACVPVDLFGYNSGAELLIKENGKTILRQVDFPTEVWWSALPVPSGSFNLSHSEFFGTVTKVEGNYTLTAEKTDQIEKATITYIADGVEGKSIDITKAMQEQSPIALSEKPGTKEAFAYRIEIQTKSGLMIQEGGTFIGKNTKSFDRIIDRNGNILWETLY